MFYIVLYMFYIVLKILYDKQNNADVHYLFPTQGDL